MTDYQPPKVWIAKPAEGRFAAINRPVAGPTHDKDLPVGKHPLQLYSLATPNGVKVTVLLEELLAAGHKGAEYDAWLIKIMDGDQFSSGFVAANPNSKIPVLVDHSGAEPVRVFESGAILIHLAEKFGAFLPGSGPARAECLSWLILADGRDADPRRRVRAFLCLCADQDRIRDRPLRNGGEAPARACSTGGWPTSEYIAGADYTIADMAIWPWYGALTKGLVYDAAEFLSVDEYTNIARWTDQIAARPAVQRGRMVNRVMGDPASQLPERHDASDFDTKTQDKLDGSLT